MATETIAQQVFAAKWLANGFPKSGTHLLAHMLRAIAPYEGPTEAGYFEQPWAGTFKGNSWTLLKVPVEHTTFRIGRIGNGHMVKAHLGYDEEIARFIYLMGANHCFMYRDLRDVAVSQAYHILESDSERLSHPAPHLYDRENFDNLLMQVIVGHRGFPSVIERWESYAGWLDDDWTLALRYEDVLAEPRAWARYIFEAAMNRMGERFRVKVTLIPDARDAVVDVMARMGERRDKSPTFRRGEPGNWREEFTPEHVAAFKAQDRGWLVKLGYEDNEDWHGRER